MSCNCSHCRRKGFLLTFVPIDQFRLTGGADRLTSYMFNKHNIDHQFCDACGCQSFSVGTGPDGSKMAAVNLRCVPEADLDALTIQKVDRSEARRVGTVSVRVDLGGRRIIKQKKYNDTRQKQQKYK